MRDTSRCQVQDNKRAKAWSGGKINDVSNSSYKYQA